MSTQKFKNIFRVALWEAYEERCFWRSEPIDYETFHIDHVIPESLAGTPELAKLLRDAGLPATFDIFGHENLVPACPPCNGRKSAMELEPHQLAFTLQLVKNSVPKLVKRLEVRRKKRNLSQAIADALISEEKGDWHIDEFIAAMQAKGYGKQSDTTSLAQALPHSPRSSWLHAHPELLYEIKSVSFSDAAFAAIELVEISDTKTLKGLMPEDFVRESPDGVFHYRIKLKDGGIVYLKYRRSAANIVVLSCHFADRL